MTRSSPLRLTAKVFTLLARRLQDCIIRDDVPYPQMWRNIHRKFCLSSYPILVEFSIDQEVTPSASSQGDYVAGQEAAGLYRPGRCPLQTNVAQHTPEEIFLEHPTFNEQGRLPFHYKTLFEYQQEDPQLLELPTSNPQQYQWKNMGGNLLVCHHHNQHNRICLNNNMLPLIVDWFHKATAHNMGITHLQETSAFISIILSSWQKSASRFLLAISVKG